MLLATIPATLVEPKRGERTAMELRGHVFIVDDDEGSRRSVQRSWNPCTFTWSVTLQPKNSCQPCLPTSRLPGDRLANARLSGVQLLEDLRQRGLTLSVLVMTAYPDTRSTVRAMRAGRSI